jgi:hypothetical protein
VLNNLWTRTVSGNPSLRKNTKLVAPSEKAIGTPKKVKAKNMNIDI